MHQRRGRGHRKEYPRSQRGLLTRKPPEQALGGQAADEAQQAGEGKTEGAKVAIETVVRMLRLNHLFTQYPVLELAGATGVAVVRCMCRSDAAPGHYFSSPSRIWRPTSGQTEPESELDATKSMKCNRSTYFLLLILLLAVLPVALGDAFHHHQDRQQQVAGPNKLLDWATCKVSWAATLRQPEPRPAPITHQMTLNDLQTSPEDLQEALQLTGRALSPSGPRNCFLLLAKWSTK